MPEQGRAESAAKAKQGADAEEVDSIRPKAEATVWTDRMVSALINGVKGGRWFSLIDKVWAPATLALAWTKVLANKGAAGVDGQSLERFAANPEKYLGELSVALKDGSYRPQPVRRVEIAKGDGGTRPSWPRSRRASAASGYSASSRSSEPDIRFPRPATSTATASTTS